MYGDNFDEVFSNIKQDGSYKNSISKKTNLSGKDLDDYMKDESQFEPDWDNFNSEEDDPDYTPMKRKTVSVKKPDGSEVKQTVVKPKTKLQHNVDTYEKVSEAERKLKEARSKRDTEKLDNVNKRKELRTQAKSDSRGREESPYAKQFGTMDESSAKPYNMTDIYLNALMDNKTIHDYTGKRTSKATDLELQRVLKKGDDYFFDDDSHGKLQKKNDSWVFEDGVKPEAATPYDYEVWSKGSNKEGTKTTGKGFSKNIAYKIQKAVYKKLIKDTFTPEEFEAIRGKIKDKTLAGITELELDLAEETILNELYKPIVEGGEQDSQDRKIFADAWTQAEAKAKSEFSRIANTDTVSDATAEAKQYRDEWEAYEKEYEKQLKDQAGPKPRTTQIVQGGGWTGFKVSGEGANASYMGRVEKDDEGNKVFRVYGANRRSNDKIPTKNAEAWIQNHIPDTYRDQVFDMAITEEHPLEYVTNIAAMAVEDNLSKAEGKFKNQNAKIRAAQDNMIQDMYFGKTLADFLKDSIISSGDKTTDSKAVKDIINNNSRLLGKLEFMHKYGMDVNAKDFTIGPRGSFEKDLLTQMQEGAALRRDVAAPKNREDFIKQGYVEQPDGTWLIQYKPDNPSTKMNRDKISKVSYGAGSTVKDKKTGRYYGETAQAERERSLNEPKKPATSLLRTLNRSK